MKRIILHAVITLFALSVITPVQAGKLVIKGSNTFGEELAPALIKEFQKKNKSVDIDLESEGSSTGIKALLNGECDIASSSRPPTEDEIRLAQSRDIQLDLHVVGYYGIAVIVHPDNPVKALSDKQIQDIFTGTITNWKQVGGKDADINLYIRNAKAGTYLGFQELAMGYNPYSDTALEKPSYHEISEAVSADPNGTGYVSLNMAHAPGNRGLIINGIHPSNSGVVEELYPYARQVRLITNGKTASRDARKFIAFIQSRNGQKVVESVGFVPRFSSKMDLGGLGP